jgi:hypothetical protein
MPSLYVAGLWGLAGAGAIEASELYGAIRVCKDFPWKRPGELKLSIYLVTVVLRLALGAFAAVVCAATGPLGGAGAVAAGIAAPKLLEELGRHAPPMVTHPLGTVRTTPEERGPADASH